MTAESTDPAQDVQDDASPSGGLPRWKIVLLSLSGLLVVSGLGLKAWSGLFGDEGGGEMARSERALNTGDRSGGTNVGQTDFLPGGTPDVGGTEPGSPRESRDVEESEREFGEWAPALITGGLSFFVGFCIGLALKSFIKISAILLGLVFLAIFGLAYFEILTIDWSTVEKYYELAVTKIKAEAESFRGFITGSLPSAGMAGLGLFTGFKKK